jgi:hypothetical protein
MNRLQNRRPRRRWRIASAALAAGVSGCVVLAILARNGAVQAGVFDNDPFIGTDTDCRKLHLVDATGVPGGWKHTYEFSGTCDLVITNAPSHTFPAEASVRWDGQQLREEFRIVGGFKYNGKIVAGRVVSVYACNDDPLITSAACSGISHENDTNLAPLSNPYKRFRPITKGKLTLQEAVGRSAKHPAVPAAKPPAPAPPPPPKAQDRLRFINPPQHFTVPTDGRTMAVQVRYKKEGLPEYVVLRWQYLNLLQGGFYRWEDRDLINRVDWTMEVGNEMQANTGVAWEKFPEKGKWRVMAMPGKAGMKSPAWVSSLESGWVEVEVPQAPAARRRR